MRSRFVKFSSAMTVAVVLAACGDNPTQETGPVTLRFKTPTFQNSVSSLDTVRGIVLIDGVTTVAVPEDTIANFPRGVHTFEARLDIDYLVAKFSQRINPRGKVAIVSVQPAGTCRIYDFDVPFCVGRNAIARRGSRVYCPAGDFGEFCTFFPDEVHVGGSWPADSLASNANEYIAHGKLLIGATVGGKKVATAFYDAGDYSPRRRLHVIPSDSSTFQAEVWTDVRHVPLYPDSSPKLAPNDRIGQLLGLSVRSTYVLPSAQKNVLFVRFDITNISDSPDYRRVHPNEPVGGHTINNVYLAPLIDPDIGGIRVVNGSRIDDSIDDNATVFPADSLVIAYDQAFAVPAFGGGYDTKPGLVGMRLIEVPVGTQARALLLDGPTNLTYGLSPGEATLEDSTYDVISGGRTGDRSNCTKSSLALICKEGGNAESAHDVRIGWSLGPIASIAPGQPPVSLTVAIIFAPPTPGTFTSGSGIMPQNADPTSTTRPIYSVAGEIRALAAAVKGFFVDGSVR